MLRPSRIVQFLALYYCGHQTLPLYHLQDQLVVDKENGLLVYQVDYTRTGCHGLTLCRPTLTQTKNVQLDTKAGRGIDATKQTRLERKSAIAIAIGWSMLYA